LSLDVWNEKGMPSADEELIEHTREIYTRAQKESEDAMDLIKKGEEYIEN